MADDPTLGRTNEQATRAKLSPDHLKFQINNIENDKRTCTFVATYFVKNVKLQKFIKIINFK
ncbi:MAG: hypothetical protein WCE96_12390, partial [Nitrososphaeraceae archaeon]